MKIKDIKHLLSSQYTSPDKLHARWDLYESAIPKINIYQTGIDYLKLQGNESVLEVGCGDGTVLLNLKQLGHKGHLVGLDINNGMFQESDRIQSKENFQPPIEFIVGSADNLPFSDKSFDVIMAFFMLYHMPDIQKTLYEWKRILKDDGKVLIATGSSLNKRKNQAFKKMAEDLIKKTVAPKFSSSFNLENAEEQLRGTFKVVDKFVYEGQIKIEKAEPYISAFNSVRDMYDPIPVDSDWEKVKEMVRIQVQEEIASKGFFSDNVKRGFFICKKSER